MTILFWVLFVAISVIVIKAAFQIGYNCGVVDGKHLEHQYYKDLTPYANID